MDHPWRIHGLSMDSPWIIHGSMDHPLIIHGLSIDYPWIIHGLSMDYPWIIHGFSMDYPWIIHGHPWISMDFQGLGEPANTSWGNRSAGCGGTARPGFLNAYLKPYKESKNPFRQAWLGNEPGKNLVFMKNLIC